MSRVASLEELFRRSCPGICLEMSWDLSGDGVLGLVRRFVLLEYTLPGICPETCIRGYLYPEICPGIWPLLVILMGMDTGIYLFDHWVRKKSRDVFGRFVKSPYISQKKKQISRQILGNKSWDMNGDLLDLWTNPRIVGSCDRIR